MSADLNDFLRSLSDSITKDLGDAPAPFEWDEDKFPFGVAPGGNKTGIEDCATCKRPPTKTPRNDLALAHLFTDELSAREYRISGMCQGCQDDVFDAPQDEDD